MSVCFAAPLLISLLFQEFQTCYRDSKVFLFFFFGREKKLVTGILGFFFFFEVKR